MGRDGWLGRLKQRSFISATASNYSFASHWAMYA
jgi:hypothetical protein